MADKITVVKYYFVRVSDEPGQADRLLEHVSEQGVNLDGYTAFPSVEGETELVFITDRAEKLKEAAADAGVELMGPQNAFLVQGQDRVGALHEYHLTLAHANVNVRASSGIGDGTGRFGMFLLVDPKDFDRAAWAFDFV